MKAKALIVCSLFILGNCEKGEPVLDETVILSISASPSTIVNYGDTTIISVRATESDGRPVFDGSRIQLVADGGSLPSEIRTVDGVATAVFTSDATIGDVTITAHSGDLGSDGAISTTIHVIDRTIEIAGSILALNPSNLGPGGGNVSCVVTVTDPADHPIVDKPVVFSSDFGQMNSNGLVLHTDNRGQARDNLVVPPVPSGIESITVKAQIGTTEAEAVLTISPNENPLPDFTYSPEEPRAGEPVFFNGSQSEDPDGFIKRYQWNFGDGGSAEGEEVSHIFPSSKTYTITLKVTDNNGAQTSFSRTLQIGNNQIPEADFTFSPANPRVYQPVIFNASSSQDLDGSLVAYKWTLSGGITREGQVVSYAFPGAGNYVVTLEVTDDNGATATTSQTVPVTGNQAPTAQFTLSPTNPRVGTKISLDASASRDVDGTITSYSWNFGSGLSGTGQLTNVTYTAPGAYLVQLTVTDNDGGKGFATQTITVSQNQAPRASFTFAPSAPLINESVLFDASASSDPEGEALQYDWTFGDGSSGTGRVVHHSFQQAGRIPVVLKVSDVRGGYDEISQNVDVGVGGVPVAQLSLTPSNLQPPGGSVLLDASASTDKEDPLGSLRFFFEAYAPPGVTVTIPSGLGPVRLAEVNGLTLGQQVVFQVRVRDTDDNDGFTSQVLQAGSSQTGSPPDAQFTVTPSQVQAPGGSVILDASTTTDSDNALNELSFQYAYQTTGSVMVSLSGSGPLQSAQLSGGNAGDLVTFLLTVTDPTQLQDSISKTVVLTSTPSNTAPTAVLTTIPANSFPQAATPVTPVGITLDARGSTDLEDPTSALTFSFNWSASNPGISATINQNPDVPALAIANVLGAVENDQIIFTLTVQDQGGLVDQTAVILLVMAPLP